MGIRKVVAGLERLAVPAAAAIVGWIVVSAWIAPHAPDGVGSDLLAGIGAALAFVLARRFL